MTITAEAVKQLRERTGAGMMECKKALVETNGDLDAAAEIMRKSGPREGRQEGGRVAAEGVDRDRALGRRPAGRAGRSQLRDGLRRARATTSAASRPTSRRRRSRASGRRRRGARWRSSSPSGETVDETRRALDRQDRREHRRAPRRACVDGAGPRRRATCTARASARWSRSKAATTSSRATSPCTSRPINPRYVRRPTCRPTSWRRSARSSSRRRSDREGQAAGDRRQDGRGPAAQVPRRDHADRASRSSRTTS